MKVEITEAWELAVEDARFKSGYRVVKPSKAIKRLMSGAAMMRVTEKGVSHLQVIADYPLYLKSPKYKKFVLGLAKKELRDRLSESAASQ